MPARVNKIRHDENTRQKIRVAHLLNTLDKCADGKLDLKPDRLKSIELLLSKSLPSLQSVEISGEIATSKVIRSPAPSATPSTWAKDHIPPHLRPTEH